MVIHIKFNITLEMINKYNSLNYLKNGIKE